MIKNQGLYITPSATLFVQAVYQWLQIQQHTSINILLIILQRAEWLQGYCKIWLSTLPWNRIETKYKVQNKVLPSHLLSLFSRNYLASYSPLTRCVLISVEIKYYWKSIIAVFLLEMTGCLVYTSMLGFINSQLLPFEIRSVSNTFQNMPWNSCQILLDIIAKTLLIIWVKFPCCVCQNQN